MRNVFVVNINIRLHLHTIWEQMGGFIIMDEILDDVMVDEVIVE